MNVKIDKYAELILKGIIPLHRAIHAAIIISEQKEADVDNNPEDPVHAYPFFGWRTCRSMCRS